MNNILPFIVTLGVLILIHEYGHYRVAVACGVRVLRFSIGFGRVLWRRQASPTSTEFVLCMLPLGGYVKMLDERESTVAPADRGQAFNRKPLWQRVAIVAAGPLANLLLAVVLYAAVYWIGMEEPKPLLAPPVAGSLAEQAGLHAADWAQEASNDGVEWRELRSLQDLRWELSQAVVRAEPLHLTLTDRDGRGRHRVVLELGRLNARELDPKVLAQIGIGAAFVEPVLGEIKEGGAGARAGLRTGDRVLSVDGAVVIDFSQVRELIRASVSNGVARSMAWRVERGGQTLSLPVLADVVTEGGQTFGRLGLFPGQPPAMVVVRYGALDGAVRAVTQTWQMSVLTLKMFGKMLIGQASLKNLSGPITIADYAGQSARLGLTYYLGFLAVVSVSLGVLNLLPLPVLDGGHLMYYLFEGVTGRPVSELWLERLQRGGVVIMLMMMSLALYNDVARLLGLQ